MKSLTIITPAYNRANLIMNLYHSLESQTNMNFCWMVVDDGSSDGTYDLVNGLISKAPFEIVCLKKENGGKHTAINFGVKQIETPLTMIVDSDDYLTYDAVQSILDIHKKYEEKDNISSYSFLRGNNIGVPIVPIEKDEFIANYITYRIRSHKPGDMAEVFKTAYLRDNPFPEFLGEKFISEDVVWIEIGKHSDSVYVNKVIYICEYLQGGLTDSDKKIKFASPLGSMMRGKQLMSKECGLKENIRGAIIFASYKRELKGNYSRYIHLNCREKILVGLFKLPSIYFYRKWKNNIGER